MKTESIQENINMQTGGIRLDVFPVHVSYTGTGKLILQSGFRQGNGYAIKTGHGFCVLDIDCKNGKNGFCSLQDAGIIIDENTVSVLTPSKGKHFYYQYPVDKQLISGSDILSGVDVKADGGLVLCPDTNIQGYGAYTWTNPPEGSQIATIPVSLLGVIRARQTARHEQYAVIPARRNDRTYEQLSAKQQHYFDVYLNRARTAENGKRSTAEFALLCWAVKIGLSENSIWNCVKDFGKFKERGDSYFDFSYKRAQGTN